MKIVCALALDLLLVGCASEGEATRPPSPLAPVPAAEQEKHVDDEVADLTKPLRTADLLPLLLRRNPSVQAARARLEAAAERRPQAVSLPDPMVEATYFTKNAMGAATRYELALRQEIPFPVVLALRGDAATKEAQAEALRYEAAVRDAVAELKDAQAERAYLAGAARVQAALSGVFRRLAELARGAGGALAVSFRADALVAQTNYETQVIGEMRDVEDRRLRSLLALPAATPLGESVDAPPARVDVDLDDLARRAVAYNQELRAAGVEVESAEIGARAARWAYAPNIEIGGGKRVADDVDAAGRAHDSTVVTLGLSLPLWFPAKATAVREADAKLRAARASEADARERLVADAARAGFRLRNAARLADLYGRELVPQAEKALLASEAMVREGKETLSSSLELAATWQQLRIAELRARADESQAAAALERLLGTSLAPAPEAAK